MCSSVRLGSEPRGIFVHFFPTTKQSNLPLCENVHVRQIMCETLKNAVSKYFKGFFDVMCLEYDIFCHQGNLMGMCTINFD